MMGTERTGRICAKVVEILNQGLRAGRGGVFLCPIAARHLTPLPKLGSNHRLLRSAELWSTASASASRASVQSSRRELFNDLPRWHNWRLNDARRCCNEAKSVAVAAGRGGITLARVAAASLGPGSGSVHAVKGKSILQVVEHYGRCYYELSKARLSLFVVSTAAVGYVMGSGEVVDWMGLVWTSVGTMLAASSANAFNQILEVTNDGLMKRTMGRPLPAGRITMSHALVFALTAGITGVTLLAYKTTSLAAELGAANVVLYTLVYTPLKQIHYINTWVGAVVGAIPPLMGWAAATGHIDAGGWVLAAALYFWQIPHFMALAYMCRNDYAAGGYKMLSLLDVSGQRIASCALRNCIYLLPLGLLAQNLGTTTGYFTAENALLTAGMGATSVLFYLRPGPETARRVFRISLLYLPVVMAAMVIHRIPHSNSSPHGLTGGETVRLGKLSRSDGELSTLTNDDELTKTGQNGNSKTLPPPPIAFLSAAPFPFLPTPEFYYR